MKPTANNPPAIQPVGRHLLADLCGLAPETLRDEKALAALLEASLWAAGFTVLGTNQHKFTTGGCGVTGVALLSESHAAFHTYPEYGYMALDVFSCGSQDPQDVLDRFVAELQPTDVMSAVHNRGMS